MKRLYLAMALTIAFLVGCITAHVASDLVVPPARAGTSPQKWEYMCVRDTDLERIQSIANKAGGEGWKMASAAGGVVMIWCFERPLP
jgi:hypothetical protein